MNEHMTDDNDTNDETAAAIFDLARNRSLDEQVSHPGREKRKLPRRFYKHAGVGPHEEGHAILLDGRVVKTPSKHPLAVPSLALAEAMAAEWEAQKDEIDPHSMWLTKLANTAIDLVATRREAVIDELVTYAGADLLCYRAAEQGIAFTPTFGILHIAQPEASLAAYRAALGKLDAFRLAALHNAVTLTGSAVTGLAVVLGRLSPLEAFDIAHLDEHWQMDLCGHDEDEVARLAIRRDELIETGRFVALLD